MTSVLLSLSDIMVVVVCDICVALQENWEFKLYVDERQQVLLVGKTPGTIVLSFYLQPSWLGGPLENVFYPPETTACFHTFTYVPLSELGQCSSIVLTALM